MVTRGYFKQTFDLILIFLFFYGLIFNAFPIPLSKVVWVYLFVRVCNKKFIISLLSNQMLKYCFWVWLIFSAHYLFMMIFTGNYYPVFLRSIFWFFAEAVLGAYLLYTYLSKRYDFKKLLTLTFIAIFIQSIFIVLTFISVPLRDSINTLLLITDERGFSSYRMKGLSNYGGASLSYLQMIGILYAGILFLTERMEKMKSTLIMTGAFVILVSQIFVARTGLMASIFLIIIVFLQQAKNRKSLFSLLRQLGIAISFIILLFPFLLILIPDNLMNTFNDRVLYRNTEILENYESSGSLRTSSTDNLQEMYFLPDSEIGILLGTAQWDENRGSREYVGRLVESDVGYVRIIFAVGVIISTVFYSMYLKYIRDLLKTDIANYINILLWSLLVIFILGEFKEPFLVRGSGVIKVLFFLYFALMGRSSLAMKKRV